MTVQTDPISAIKKWVQAVIMGHQICPFAREAMTRTHYMTSSMTTLEESIGHILDTLTQPNAQIDNVLLVIPKGMESFETFWEVCEGLEMNLEQSGVVKFVQLAHFHPLYRFDGLDQDDRANWTNRSPLPILHFLSASAVSRAVESYPHPEQIPERNVAYLRNLNDTEFAALCNYESDSTPD